MGRRGRAGQGEGPSLSVFPGYDYSRKIVLGHGRGGPGYSGPPPTMAPRGSPGCIGAMPKAVLVTGRLGTGVHLVHGLTWHTKGRQAGWSGVCYGWALSLQDGKGSTMEYVITEGGERGRGGRVRCPPCSPPEGSHPKLQ